MIANFASTVVATLIRHDIIRVQQAPAYQYGYEILFSSLLTCVIAILCGIFLQCIPASLLYLGMFVSLRLICGGYHAKTYWKCNMIFGFVTLTVLLFYKYISLQAFSKLHYCFLAIAILTTFFYAPVENENKPLSQKKKLFFRILSMALVILLSITACLLKIKYGSSYCVLIDTTLFVVAISMFITNPKRGGEQKCSRASKTSS